MTDTMRFQELLTIYVGRYQKQNGNISQAKIAKQLGYSGSMLTRWLSRENHPDFTAVLLLAHTLQLQDDEILEFVQVAGYSEPYQLAKGGPPLETEKYESDILQEILLRTTNNETLLIEVRDKFQKSEHLFPLFVNVPPRPNLFVGRDELVSDLVERLLSNSAIALSSQSMAGIDRSKIAMDGLPGIGKTAMAQTLAYHPDILEHFTDGVLWGGLGSSSDAMSTLIKWGEALGIDVSPNDESETQVTMVSTVKLAAEKVSSAIGQRRILIVIDDAWDVKSANHLRCGGPNCCHLLTTRNYQVARDFAGYSQVETIPVLDDLASWQLINELAPEVCKTAPESVQTLLDRAGGLPLTIVLLGGLLAAPEHSMFDEIRSETVEKLEQLSNPLDPMSRLQLAMERLGSLDDQELTLQETIALSIEVLPEELQETFYALGAFAPKPEWFGRDAAESVAQTNSRFLAILIARNLVEKISNTELALHQSLADAARINTRSKTIKRHQEHYLSIAQENELEWYSIEQSYGQIKWAYNLLSDEESILRYIRALKDFQIRSGLWEDTSELIQRALQFTVANGWESSTAALIMVKGDIQQWLGRWESPIMVSHVLGGSETCREPQMQETALKCYESSLEIVRRIGDSSLESAVLNRLAIAYSAIGEYNRSLELFDASLSLLPERNSKPFPSILCNKGGVYVEIGDFHKAMNCFQEGLDISKNNGDKESEAGCFHQMAHAYFIANDLDNASAKFQDALRIFDELGRRDQRETARFSLAATYSKDHKFDKALSLLEQSLSFYQETNKRFSEAVILHTIASIYGEIRYLDKALSIYNRVISILEELGDSQQKSLTLSNMACCYSYQNNYPRALALFDEALNEAIKIDSKQREALIRSNIGIIHTHLGNAKEALEQFNKALRIYRETGNEALEADVVFYVGNLHYTVENFSLAHHSYTQAIKIFQSIENKRGEVNVLLMLGQLWLLRGSPEKSLETYYLAERMSESAKLTYLNTLALIQLGDFYINPDLELNFEKAYNFYQNALRIFTSKHNRNRLMEARILERIGAAYYRVNMFEEGVNYLFQTLEIRKEMNDSVGEANLYYPLARFYDEQGDVEKAIRTFKCSIDIWVELGEWGKEITDRAGLAEYAFLKGDFVLGKEQTFLIRELASKHGDIDTQRQIKRLVLTMPLIRIAIVYLHIRKKFTNSLISSTLRYRYHRFVESIKTIALSTYA